MGFQHIRYIHKLIETAEDDHQASKLLYKNGMYSQSIYFLQQSVEKLVKSCAVLTGDSTPEDIRKEIGHETPRAFVTPLVKWWSSVLKLLKLLEETDKNHEFIEYTRKSQSIIPEVEDFVKNYDKYKENIRKTFIEIGTKLAIIDEKNIRKILRANLQFRTFIHDWLDNDSMIKDVELLLSSQKITLPENISEVEKEKTLDGIRKRRRFFLNYGNMFILAIITYPHATFTRYPNDTLSPHEYNKEIGIVHCYRKISSLLGVAINWFREDLDRVTNIAMKDSSSF